MKYLIKDDMEEYVGRLLPNDGPYNNYNSVFDKEKAYIFPNLISCRVFAMSCNGNDNLIEEIYPLKIHAI